MKIIFLREKSDIRMQLLKSKLEELGHIIDIFDMVNYELIESDVSNIIFKKNKFIEKILPLVLIKRLLSALIIYSKLKDDYDVCHIFNIKRQNFWLIPLMKRKVKKIVTMVYGPSTFEYWSKRFFFDKIYKHIDVITFSNPEFKERFNNVYEKKFEQKTKLMMIPFKILNQIDELNNKETSLESRKILGIDTDLKTVLCSTSGMPLENHFKIVDSIKKIDIDNHKFLFIFMLTYGGTQHYLEKLKNYIINNLQNHQFLIFDKYLTNIDVARLRRSTDIMINVRKNDQITGHMLESFYTGSIVIAGDWLPYKILDLWNIFYIKINSIQNIAANLEDLVNNFDEYKQKAKTNKSILKDVLNENRIVKDWIDIYSN